MKIKQLLSFCKACLMLNPLEKYGIKIYYYALSIFLIKPQHPAGRYCKQIMPQGVRSTFGFLNPGRIQNGCFSNFFLSSFPNPILFRHGHLGQSNILFFGNLFNFIKPAGKLFIGPP